MSRRFSDKEIIDALSGQDRRQINPAMDALYQLVFPSVSAYVLKNSGTQEAAHDIFQDALVVLYMKVKKGEFKLSSSLKTYLYAVSKNLWLKELRKSQKTGTDITQAEPHEFPQELILQENQITIRQVLALIDEGCRQLLLDFYFDSKPVKELKVKYKLGSEAATKNKKYRCLQKLVAMVKQKKWGRSDFLND